MKKIPDTIQWSLLENNFKSLNLRVMGVYQKLTASIVLTNEMLEAVSLKSETTLGVLSRKRLNMGKQVLTGSMEGYHNGK